MDKIEPQQSQSSNDIQYTGSFTSHDLDIIPLKGYFGINIPSTTELSQLRWIQDYFQQLQTHTTTDMFLNIKDIENRLGMARLGDSRLTRIYEYLKVNHQLSQLEALRDSMYAR